MWIGLFVVTWIVCNGHTVIQPNTGTMVKSTGQHLNAAVINNILVFSVLYKSSNSLYDTVILK